MTNKKDAVPVFTTMLTPEQMFESYKESIEKQLNDPNVEEYEVLCFTGLVRMKGDDASKIITTTMGIDVDDVVTYQGLAQAAGIAVATPLIHDTRRTENYETLFNRFGDAYEGFRYGLLKELEPYELDGMKRIAKKKMEEDTDGD